MTGIQWLKLNETNLTEIPEEMGKLLKLVKLSAYGRLFFNCVQSLE